MAVFRYQTLAVLGLYFLLASQPSMNTVLAAEGELYNSEKSTEQPMSAEESLAALQLPPGFRADLYSSEPAVQNPIAACFDTRGRMWVAENYTYAEPSVRFDLKLHDRIIILNDADGDGKAESRVVFTDNLQMLTGLVVEPGGVWVMAPSQLLFIADANQDDIPDGPPTVVLDGFDVAQHNYHNCASGLSFGPDGWLYGRCGGSCPGEVGRPGMTAEQRIPLRGGVWRYHPRTQVFESIAAGTTNPWGHDWNEKGDLFFINTVNGHLWHAVTGAHFTRLYSHDPHPTAYEMIDQHADHYHFDTGRGWTASRDGSSSDLGGGHAHIGCMIYQADQWPDNYYGKLMTLNFHGRRINVEHLDPVGGGYVGRHQPDLMPSLDPWFRGMDLMMGPEGSVYILDWSDTGECHEYTGVHRTSGRIYRVSYDSQLDSGKPPSEPTALKPFDLQQQTPAELVSLQNHTNDWWARQARLTLAQGLTGQKWALTTNQATAGVVPVLKRQLADTTTSTTIRLRSLWTLYQLGALNTAELLELLDDSDAAVRVWGVRLLSDDWLIDTVAGQRPTAAWATHSPRVACTPEVRARLVRLAREDQSAAVRLTLASALQRLEVAHRAELAIELVRHADDASDHNLPLIVWYGITPIADETPESLVEIAMACAWPKTRQLIARRLAEFLGTNGAPLDALLNAATSGSRELRTDLLLGLQAGLAGRKQVPLPSKWSTFARAALSDPELRLPVLAMGASFGDPLAVRMLNMLVTDDSKDLPVRVQALQGLVNAHSPGLVDLCKTLLGTPFLNTVAVQGLASQNDPLLGALVIEHYASIPESERPLVVSVLVSRKTWAAALLEGMAAKTVPRQDLSAYQIRQIQEYQDAALSARLAEVWGEFRETSADRKELIAQLKSQLADQQPDEQSASRGRVLFQKSCVACHMLYGEGGKRGPDLTGAQRQNMDYLLENIIDPSAVVPGDYRVTVLQLVDGRVLSGMISARGENTLTLQTQTEVITVALADIEEQQGSSLSLMPEGLLTPLTTEQRADLFAYLMTKQQVPAAAELTP